ncbi:DUF4157 domain-containing protein [uncultured Kordia sp.]|uniref:eCIS core domain-containing protein n=1 Tax=uncultured Kordia sp. TaxID=507699 RepID=UPI00263231DF|nr:DUF4157 domain-containing protein [uncultured Kordia sp.]
MYQKKQQKTLQQKSAANHIADTKNDVVALKDNRSVSTIQKKKNNTGLPDNLKSGMEGISGHSLDDVKVHYNSSKPSQLNAHAYAQGTNIHVASGQEKHLPHEAWHVVQQKQGRVKPTVKKNGVAINDNPGLEKEADVMGAKAIQQKAVSNETTQLQEVAQLGRKKHPKKASGTGMARKDPGHGNVKSKQHAKKRAKKDGKRAAKRKEEIARLQQKREDDERRRNGGGPPPGGAGGGIAV